VGNPGVYRWVVHEARKEETRERDILVGRDFVGKPEGK
jgi:hypothetical protein